MILRHFVCSPSRSKRKMGDNFNNRCVVLIGFPFVTQRADIVDRVTLDDLTQTLASSSNKKAS